MKKITLLILAFLAFSFSFSQTDIPLVNGDIESNTPMTSEDNKTYTIDGMYIFENTASDIFDEANSGLAPGEGIDGSQALKSTIHNAAGATANVVLATDMVDISSHGLGNYTYKIFIKSQTLPATRPIWMVYFAFDEDLTSVPATIEKIDNGGTITWQDLPNGFTEASVSINLINNPSGKDAKFLRLAVQHAREDNTFWFDNITLTGPAPLSLKELKSIGVSMYPNPARDSSILKSESVINSVELYSLTGKLIFNKSIDAREYNLDVSSYSKGMYLLSVTNDKGKSTTKLIVD